MLGAVSMLDHFINNVSNDGTCFLSLITGFYI